MSQKNAIHVINAKLQELRSSFQPFGGFVLILAEEFREALPIIGKIHPSDEQEACIKHSHVWCFVQM